MKILLLGKDGQVGQELQRTLLPLGDTLALGRSEADLSDSPMLRETLSNHGPDIIVNAAAYTAVDKAESEPDTAARINTDAVSVLAQYAKANNATLIHYSTDYVFSGAGETPYVETDLTSPESVYGTTKRDGEIAIIESGCRCLIFRTSWVFSSQGGNFLKTILRLAATKSELNVVADQYGAPTSAELIADITALAIHGNCQDRLPNGIYHLAASGATSWCQFARYIVSQAQARGVDLQLTTDKIHPIPASEYPTPAKRPKNSRLNTNKLSQALQLRMPHWTLHTDRAIDQLIRLGNQKNA